MTGVQTCALPICSGFKKNNPHQVDVDFVFFGAARHSDKNANRVEESLGWQK